MIGAALRSILVADSGLTALTGSKVFPLIVPQGQSYPALAYQVVSDTPIRCKAPIGTTADEYRFQVSAYASTYLLMEQIAKAVRLALDNYQGESEEETVLRVYFDGQRDLYEEEPRLFHRAMDFRVFVHNN